MKVLINITSYDRKEFLEQLLTDLKGYEVIVWDDASNFRLSGDFYFYQFKENYGKKKAWLKFRRIFKFILEDYSDYDYYFFIPDDVILKKEFINESIKIWESIKDDSKICLSLLSDDRVKAPCWTNINPVKKGNVIQTQWSDLCFISEIKFFKEVKIDEIGELRWEKEPTLGSGVGSTISRNLHKKGYNMYHVKETLCKHRRNHVSKMNHYE